MRGKKKRWTALFLLFAFLCSIAAPVSAAVEKPQITAEHQSVIDTVADVSDVLMKNNPQPKPGSIGGEWLILGLARSDAEVADTYYNTYYTALETAVKDAKGVLHQRKYTEYSRTVLALTAMGKDPAKVGGYNLLLPLGDYKATVQQGLNGAVFALLALDSGDYAMPVNQNAKIKATRQLYISYILGKELSGGGWAVSGSTVDIDMTAMVLQALAPYTDTETAKAAKTDVKKVQAAVDRGVQKLSALQNQNGGFTAYGVESCESAAQVIVALCTLGIDLNDARFVKNKNTLMGHLMTFYQNGKGFSHVAGGEINGMATEQAFYALVAAERACSGKHTLYDMTAESAETVQANDIEPEKAVSSVQKALQQISGLMRKGA